MTRAGLHWFTYISHCFKPCSWLLREVTWRITWEPLRSRFLLPHFLEPMDYACVIHLKTFEGGQRIAEQNIHVYIYNMSTYIDRGYFSFRTHNFFFKMCLKDYTDVTWKWLQSYRNSQETIPTWLNKSGPTLSGSWHPIGWIWSGRGQRGNRVGRQQHEHQC